jgi:hypothetical protein
MEKEMRKSPAAVPSPLISDGSDYEELCKSGTDSRLIMNRGWGKWIPIPTDDCCVKLIAALASCPENVL